MAPAAATRHALALSVRLALPAILLLGLTIRLWLIDTQSAWLDESWSIFMSDRSPRMLLDAIIHSDNHPPTYYVLLHLWMQVAGSGVAQARMLNVLLGVGAIAALYAVADLLFDRATGLCAAFLLAISPVATWYSDELRMYAPVYLCALLTIYTMLRAIREGRARWWLAYAVCTALSFSFDSSGAYIPLALNGYYLVLAVRRLVPVRPWLAANALALLLASPALALFSYQSEHNLGEVAWIPAPTPAVVWAAARDLVSLNSDAVATGAVLAALAVCGALAVLRDRANPRVRRVYLLLLFLAVTPFAVPLVLSIIHPVFLMRTAQTAVFGLLLFCARGVVVLLNGRWRAIPGLIALGALLWLNGAALQATASTVQKDDWRQAAQFTARTAPAHTLLIFDALYFAIPFDLYFQSYHRNLDEHGAPRIQSSDPASFTAGHATVWLVTSHTGSMVPDDSTGSFLLRNFHLGHVTLFHGITVFEFHR